MGNTNFVSVKFLKKDFEEAIEFLNKEIGIDSFDIDYKSQEVCNSSKVGTIPVLELLEKSKFDFFYRWFDDYSERTEYVIRHNGDTFYHTQYDSDAAPYDKVAEKKLENLIHIFLDNLNDLQIVKKEKISLGGCSHHSNEVNTEAYLIDVKNGNNYTCNYMAIVSRIAWEELCAEANDDWQEKIYLEGILKMNFSAKYGNDFVFYQELKDIPDDEIFDKAAFAAIEDFFEG